MKIVVLNDFTLGSNNSYLLEMPQVVAKNLLNKYKAWFYDTEGNSKGINPSMEDKSIKNVHVHISRLKDYNTLAKLWITDTEVFPVKESDNYKCQLSNKELKEIRNILDSNKNEIVSKWMNHFGFLNTRYQPTEQERIVLKQEKKSRELEIKREKDNKRNKSKNRR